MARPARRTRSPHPGIVLIRPDGTRAAWRARYTDPDTEKVVKVRLDPVALRTAETRRAWAIQKSHALAKRRMDLEAGAPRATGTPLVEAIGSYYRTHDRLREKTLKGYRAATDALLAWAASVGVISTDDLTRARLMMFRESLITRPKQRAAKRAWRGARTATAKPRSAYAVNRDLASVRTVLGYLAELDLLPAIREGDLRRAFRKLRVDRERTMFLSREEIAALLAACDAHDQATFSATRAEHAGEGEPGSTPRYQPIRPFALGLLLSGMRLGEAATLTWGQVDLAAGEIRLTSATKTHRARTVDLSVSPMLVASLTALRPPEPASTASVWGLSYDAALAAQKRLRGDFEAPGTFSWQVLRATTATFLTNAPGIFGAASAYRSARQLGHSVTVAERHYLGVVRVDPEAKTLEAAMGIDGGAQ